MPNKLKNEQSFSFIKWRHLFSPPKRPQREEGVGNTRAFGHWGNFRNLLVCLWELGDNLESQRTLMEPNKKNICRLIVNVIVKSRSDINNT